jgi:hypothetical protein
MIAAMLCQDDRLLGWLQIVAEIRYNTKVCDEFLAILQNEDLFQLRDPVYLQHEVYKDALMMVEDIQSKLKAGVLYGTSKI